MPADGRRVHGPSRCARVAGKGAAAVRIAFIRTAVSGGTYVVVVAAVQDVLPRDATAAGRGKGRRAVGSRSLAALATVRRGYPRAGAWGSRITRLTSCG